ncbi:MAG: aminofutalosine synthase MqnE [Armatimonadetes bacterium]|nr:aminofutalosine synthase MqnE [Armatimonadota bacterium]
MIDLMIEKSDVGDILRRALDGERLGVEDGVRLFESNDVAAIGAVANQIRTRINGDRAYYVINRHINYTDICQNRCRFCAFSRSEGDPNAYAMSIDEIIHRAQTQWQSIKFTELHLVGGLHPTLPLSYYTDMLSALNQRFPTVHIQAFTAVEIAHIAKIGGLSIKETLIELRDAGLGSIPGGGAEVFSPRVRSIVCPEKMLGEKWLDVMRQAHELGIKSNSTMLYGHVETYRERVEHMVALRKLQDETGGFMTFIPLKFHAANTDLSQLASPISSTEDLKLYSVSRLMVDNIEHVKVFWIMLGLKLAQVALSFGADDFDGTVVEEKITHRAGASTPQGLTVSDIKRLIEESGHRPVERDTVYNLIPAGTP